MSLCVILLTLAMCLHATGVAGLQPEPLPTELNVDRAL
jgi:hypothetical protein